MSEVHQPYPYVQRAFDYVNGVMDGSIPACKWIKLACERFRRDLEHAGEDDPDFPYHFDVDKAEKLCRFVSKFPHVKGKWAAKRELFDPQPWQCFYYVNIGGWLHKKTDLRRFRKVRLYVPRKNGKSLMVAPLGLYMLCADGEPGAEVFSGATNEKQAWEVFGPAKQMAVLTPAFIEHFGVQINAKSIVIPGSLAKFEPIIGKPGDGSSPHCSITDEYHEHQDDTQLATMETGMGARAQPLSIVVSTAGDNISGPCRDDWLECQRMLDGTIADETLFALIYTIDKDDEWTDEASLRKANPNFGVSVSADFLLAQLREAVNNARKQGHFKIKHLNVWVQARDAYINVQSWRAAADPTRTWARYAGRSCYAGMDLASKVDLVALEFLFDEPDGSLTRFGRYYLPRATVDAPGNEHYQKWEKMGLLQVTEGNLTDYFQILEDLKQIGREVEVKEIAFDPHNATMLVTALENEGFVTVEFGPTVLNFSEPMKQVEALIRDGKLHHDGDPVMEWAMSNVVAKVDRKDNVFPNKERPENKIDPFVALCMAMGRYMSSEASDDFSGFITNPVVA